MIKLNLADSRGPVLLNPRHIVSISQSSSRAVCFVRMSDGVQYEVRETVAEVESKFPRGGV